MKNALLITYYWPPAGGAGVHRWLRFSQYFTSNGWKLTIYCPDDAAWPIIDPELNDFVPSDLTIIRNSIFEPHKYLSNGNKSYSGSGLGTAKKAGILQKLLVWLRGNLFIPDSRKFWIRPSVRYLSKYLKSHPEITAIISTGPPHSMHLIARRIKQKFGVKWIADFRDPWTEIDFYNDLKPGFFADKKQKRLEKSVLEEADTVVAVSDDGANGLSRIGKRPIEVITNGYVFPDFNPKEVDLDKRFTIAHFGSMPFARNPEVLWKSLSLLLEQIPELSNHLEIKLIGAVDYQVKLSLEKYFLGDFLSEIPQVKHSESIQMQRGSQVLLLVANNSGNVKGILTGKFFEYLGAKRPILAIGQKDSDLSREVELTDCGVFADYDDEDVTVDFIHTSFKLFLENNLWSQSKNTDRFNSRNLAGQYITLLNSSNNPKIM